MHVLPGRKPSVFPTLMEADGMEAAAETLQRHARGRKARRFYSHKRSGAINDTKMMMQMDSKDLVDHVQSQALLHLESMIKRLGKGQNDLAQQLEAQKVEIGPQRLLDAERRAEAAEARAAAAEAQCTHLVNRLQALDDTVHERLYRAEKAVTDHAAHLTRTVSPWVEGHCIALDERLTDTDRRLGRLEVQLANHEAVRRQTDAATNAAAEATRRLEQLGLEDIPRRIAASKEALTKEVSSVSERCKQREKELQRQVDGLREELTTVRAHHARHTGELTALRLPVESHEGRLRAVESYQEEQPTVMHELIQKHMMQTATEMLPPRPSTTPSARGAGGGFQPRYVGNLFAPEDGLSERPSTTMALLGARDGGRGPLASSAWGSTRGYGESAALPPLVF